MIQYAAQESDAPEVNHHLEDQAARDQFNPLPPSISEDTASVFERSCR